MDKYKTQDIILKTDYTMITSKLADGVIVMYVYNNEFADRERWILNEDFNIGRKRFDDLSATVSFLLAGYIREMCSTEAINDRIYNGIRI